MGEHISRTVVNPVLTYISSSLLHSSAQATKAACKSFYTLEELLLAKDILWDVGDEKILDKKISRRDSSKGNEVDKVLDDLLTGVNKLSAADQLPMFTVDARGLARIPKAAPHEALPISLCERVNALEEKLKKVMDALCASKHSSPQTQEYLDTGGAMGAPMMDMDTDVHMSTSQTNPKSKGLPQNPLQAKSRPMSMADAASKLNDGDFTMVKKPRKRLPPAKGKASAHSDGSTFKGGPLTFRLALTNVDPSADVKSISDYIKKSSNNSISPSSGEVKDESSDGWPTKRFIVTFKRSDYDAVMSPDFWPEGVFYRQWFTPKSNGTTEGNG